VTIAMTGTQRQVAIITGGSRGIGAGLVAGYRQRGWAVVVNDLSIEPATQEGIATVAGDISKPATADLVMSTAIEHFGRVDTLVNNAGVFISKPFTDYTADDYELVTRVNLAGFLWLTQRAITDMLHRGHGHVVNISAMVAERPDSRSPSVLAALTKGGLAAAAKSLAIEYASRGIRVNAVAPGVIQAPSQPADSYRDLMPPLGRVGQVSDIVDGILYLESAPFITGEILFIDGGQNAGH
jgi:NAD(P)-dependent dehydrogenase (short-subunit alcohol dehydrogenase family)